MRLLKKTTFVIIAALTALLGFSLQAGAQPDSSGSAGYYRFPAIHNRTIVFTAEGDLWKVDLDGGLAQRLTTHHASETHPAISPDGSVIAFMARYEGPAEVYTMPIEGGLPTRRTFDGGWARPIAWSPDGRLLFAASRYATLPDVQMAALDMKSNRMEILPLQQAADGVYRADGKTFFFTRLPFVGSHTKHYMGGAVQNIWKYTSDDPEAVPLTADYLGTSKEPMWWDGRIYFVSDRDGTMNIWSMTPDGGNQRQHTRHQGWDVKSPSLSQGRIAYQLGADIHVYDVTADQDKIVPIRLVSDFDQMREKWIKKPFDYLTALHLSTDGDRVVLTARGQVFTVPSSQGRLVKTTHNDGARYRQARFLPDGKQLLALSDESGEVEFWKLPTDGVGDPEQLTAGGAILRFDGVPSPDGKFIAYTDKDNLLWLYDIEKKAHTRIFGNGEGQISDLQWSPDSRWLAFAAPALNWFTQIHVLNLENRNLTALTTDRYDTFSPAWSADGKWLYFLSNRSFVSLVNNPWESRQAEPYFDRQTKIYMIPLLPGLRSPFQPDDELAPDSAAQVKPEKKDQGKESDSAAAVVVKIDTAGIQKRLMEVPLPAGNYGELSMTADHLYWISVETSALRTRTLVTAKIDNKEIKLDTVQGGVGSYELSLDRKKLMARKDNSIYVFDANGAKPADLGQTRVNLDDWAFSLDPRQEWRQMFVEAWRLERDYFYDRNMHGVDWPAMLNKYLLLIDRVTDRDELSDLLADLISELSALHMYVQGGDPRRGEDDVSPASLGAVLKRDDDVGGFRVEHVYRVDPDEPQIMSPLAKPGVEVHEGEVITAINGVSTLGVEHPGLLLRRQAGKQVLLEIKSTSNQSRPVVVIPITPAEESNLRYSEWEYTRRLLVEEKGQGNIGYVHLRNMGINDYAQWARDFYPVFLRQGLIVDVRHNNGGNVDSWILEKLMRKPWAYWQSRTGDPYSNMQYAFAGHVVVLCDEHTYSDGELFVEGFRRLGLGKVIGARTSGAEIWLSFSNVLVDQGIATAAEDGVYAPEGIWLIEGHGVEPDIAVDNPPHATFAGQDAQLEAAIRYLQEQITLHPVKTPPPPPYPDKSFDKK